MLLGQLNSGVLKDPATPRAASVVVHSCRWHSMGRIRWAITVVAMLLVGSVAVGGVATQPADAQGSTDSPSTTTTSDPGDPGGTGVQPEPEPGVIAPQDTTPSSSTSPERPKVTKRLVFPVVGASYFYAGFGGCRDNCTREHLGIDIMTSDWRGLPVVAAKDGTVTTVTYDKGNAGCSVHIRHRDRWETRYLHLNNDVPGTDEIGAPCPAPGIEPGVKVKAGQIIGYVGDSGNAESGPPHLHFELRTPSGEAVDPYRSLRRADRILFEWLPPDLSAATLAISRSHDATPSTTIVVLVADEAATLTSREVAGLRLPAPVIAVDRLDPGPALIEIERLGSHGIIIMSNSDTRWLHDLLVDQAPIVASIPLPPTWHHHDPDVVEWGYSVLNQRVTDSFATIITGRVDSIRRSHTEAFETFATQHWSIVLTSDVSGVTPIGVSSATSPGPRNDRTLYWWATGDGWIGTDSRFTVPERGYAHVTERRATPWTLTFLGSLSSTDPMPLWRTD